MNKIFVFIVFISFYAVGQINSNASALVAINLIKGISTELVSGNLDYGEIILNGNSSIINREPENGAVIKILGHPNKFINFNFSSIELSNTSDNLLENSEQLLFSPSLVHTGASNYYNNPVNINSGESYKLEADDGEGLIYLWIGGEINVAQNQTSGNYSGIFQVTISY